MSDLSTNRLRILIGADTFIPDVNGAARFTRDLAVRLSKRGHDVHVVAPATSTRSATGIELIDGQPISVHRLGSVRWPSHDWLRFVPPWRVRAAAGRILDEVTPDVVHVQSFINIGRGLAREAHARELPLMATNHVMPDNIVDVSGFPEVLKPRLAQIGWNLADSVLTLADTVTSPTPIAARYLTENTSVGTVIPLSCGIDLERFTPRFERPAGNRVVYVGRLDPEKNIDTLLTAYSMVPRELSDGLDLVGGGTAHSRLQACARELGIEDRVVFHGRVSDERLIELHEQASVFVMASTAELQSIATLEAMACGTPVVLADAMALPHLIEHGENGHLVEPQNAEEFARAIESILRNDDEADERMRRAAFGKAQEHDAQNVILRYEELYEQIAAVTRGSVDEAEDADDEDAAA
ncbi:glycosyltransferase [Leifsonia sp. YAF41]|uniref:glycosyltransferase n=1 Tax=Leifsonia sp. YAF41 TaxID=3233086 RepID=UPI003F97B31C